MNDQNNNAPDINKDIVNPRILNRGLKRFQGLINGNGFDAKIITIDDNDIKILRFQAHTTIKLRTEYALKVELGKNTSAEIVANEEEFRRIMDNMVQDSVNNPQKRKQIIKIIKSRPDKGFGIIDNKFSLHALGKTLVWHEKCQTCNGMGKNNCARCAGNKLINCIHCQSRRQISCPNCRGSTYVQTVNGRKKCDSCHGDGFISCPKCLGRGKIKCLSCKGYGFINCKNCAVTGTLSHVAVVKLLAQIKFNFDDSNLPIFLAIKLKENPIKLAQKHDIEIIQQPDVIPNPVINSVDTIDENKEKSQEEPKDIININFNVTCPVGKINFKMGDNKVIGGTLFGYQSRLIDMPPFLDMLTKKGQAAFFAASIKGADIKAIIPQATRFAMLKDILLNVILFGGNKKTTIQLFEKYGTGIGIEKLSKLVKCANIIIQNATNRACYTGMTVGIVIYSILFFAFLWFGHNYLSIILMRIGIIALLLSGIGITVITARFGGLMVQYRQFSGIIDDNILRKNLPPIGNILWWIIFAITMVSGGILSILWNITKTLT